MRLLLSLLAVTVCLWVALVLALVLTGRRVHARELALLIPNIVRLFRGLLGDARVPKRTKWLLAAGAIWVASPIDLIPEFIPVLGPLDDAVVAALILRHVVKKAGPDVVTEHWRGDPETLQSIVRVMRVAEGSQS